PTSKENIFMTTHTSSLREPKKRSIAKIFGVLFICACLLAGALNLWLPHGSRAASNETIIKPVADTFVSSRQPERTYGSSSPLEVRRVPAMTSLLRFEVQGLGQGSVANAHLRLFAVRGSGDQPAGLQLFAVPASWDEQAVSWNQQPALGQPIVQAAPAPIEKGQWIDIDLGRTIGGDGVYSFALTTDSNERLSFRSSARAEAPQLALTLQGDAAPVAGDQAAPTAAPATGDDTDDQGDAAAPASDAPDANLPDATAPDAVAPSAALAVSTAATSQIVAVQVGPGYLAGPELAQRTQLASKGVEPYKSAVSNAISFANGKLGSSPSPQQPLNISGTTGPFVGDTATAYGLALAYGVTGDVKYAKKARDFIMAWVKTTT